MIVDCHTHIFPDSVQSDREAFCEKDKGFSSLYENPKAKIARVEELISAMDEAEVAWSVILGFPWDREDLCRFHNEYLFESASRYPDRLVVFVTVPLSDPDAAVLEFEWALKWGARGVGEAGFYGREMTHTEIERMSPLLSAMEKEGLPFLLHTNETLGHVYPGKGRTPIDRFYDLIQAFPNLPVILAHWGGGLPFYELMPEVKKAMRRVYYDTAASPLLYSDKIYALGKEMVGPEKILLGSDFPLLSPKRYLSELQRANLTEEERAKILGENARALLRLDGNPLENP